MCVDAVMHAHTCDHLRPWSDPAVSLGFSLTFALCAVIPALRQTRVVCVTCAGLCAPC